MTVIPRNTHTRMHAHTHTRARARYVSTYVRTYDYIRTYILLLVSVKRHKLSDKIVVDLVCIKMIIYVHTPEIRISITLGNLKLYVGNHKQQRNVPLTKY